MMKGLRTFLYELKYAFLQMKRHIMLCFSAISAIGITLLLIGSILIIGLHVNYFSNDVQKDLSIHVILNEDIDDETAISSIQSEISKLKNVSKVEVSSKDDELELKESVEDDTDGFDPKVLEESEDNALITDDDFAGMSVEEDGELVDEKEEEQNSFEDELSVDDSDTYDEV